jgi:glycosyltransferase involved in cell wall biosynthesis
MNILMISSTFPYPPTLTGTEVRTFNLLKYLHQRHTVTLVTQCHPEVPAQDVAALREYVSDLVIFPFGEGAEPATAIARIAGKVGQFARSWWQRTPPNVLHRYSADIQTWVDERVKAQKFDAITCEHSANAIYVRPEYQKSVKTVVNVHSSVYWAARNQLEKGASTYQFRDRLYLPVLYAYEKRYCNHFSDIVVTTEDDRRQMHPFNPHAQMHVIPNGVDLDLFPYRTTDPGGHQLIFVGAMDLAPNIGAARFFALEVFPAVQKRYPDATFYIVGGRPTPEVEVLAQNPGVVVTGRVPSVAEYMHQSVVCVVPLLTGFGIKNKTLEAMATGVPIVGSDRGLEGLAVDGANTPLRALRANQVEEYVSAISRLFEEADLRSQLAQAGRELVERAFTWEQAGHAYEQVLSPNRN